VIDFGAFMARAGELHGTEFDRGWSLPSRRPVQPCPDPRSRLIVAHLKHTAGRLYFVAGAPAGHEGAREGRVEEVDRESVPQRAAHPRRRQRPAICAAIRVEPRPHLIEPAAKSFGWHAIRIRPGSAAQPLPSSASSLISHLPAVAAAARSPRDYRAHSTGSGAGHIALFTF
jgi:hypothetical protein